MKRKMLRGMGLESQSSLGDALTAYARRMLSGRSDAL
jgi:hypothetical protein